MLANSSRYERLSPAARRVHDALEREAGALSTSALVRRTHHAERTVQKALKELREDDLAERVPSWPVPKHRLTDRQTH